MKEGKASEAKSGNKGLVILLCVFVVVIVGLGVGVIVTRKIGQNNETKHVTEDDIVLPEELQGDDLSPIDQITKEATLMSSNPDYSGQDIENYYDAAIDEAMVSGDTGFAAQIIIQKMQFIAIAEEDCSRVIEYINSINLAEFSVEVRPYLASRVASVANYCEDQALADSWQRLTNGDFNE